MKVFEVRVSSIVSGTLLIGAENAREANKTAREQMEESLARTLDEASDAGQLDHVSNTTGRIVIHEVKEAYTTARV
jgi:hypothetical protein